MNETSEIKTKYAGWSYNNSSSRNHYFVKGVSLCRNHTATELSGYGYDLRACVKCDRRLRKAVS
jgi:hypothetical protein